MKQRSTILSALFLCIIISAFAQTTVPGGDVSGTWYLAGSPYLIEGDITIPDDFTLNIQAGVEVEFQGHFALTVLGRLLAVGTESDSIHFSVNDTTGFGNQSTASGGWYGIRFLDTPIGNDSSKIVYCLLEYGKAYGDVWHLNAGGAICILQYGKVLISNCLIKNNSAYSSSDHMPIGGGIYLFKSDVILRNNTFLNNRAHSGGAVYFDNSNPVFENNIFESNFAVEGGGIGIGGTSQPRFSGDHFLNNKAENLGGGLLFYEPSVVICNNITVSGNKAIWGAGIGVQGGELQANNCLFYGNRAELWGGGVAGDFATLYLKHCTFEKDTSDWGSGGLHMDHALGDIENCDFVENRAVFGGGFHGLFSQIRSVHSTFMNNQTDGGGGIHLEDCDCTIDLCHFQGNQALVGTGGAIDYSADTTIFGRDYQLTISRTSIIENSAFYHSGAVLIEQTQSDSSMVDLFIDSCQFIKNQADVYGSLRIGGGIKGFEVSNSVFRSNTSKRYVGGAGFITDSRGRVENCIFNSNYAGYSDSTLTAHGASLATGAEVDFVNCTFVDTSSADGNGLSIRRDSHARLSNCIFWGCGNHPVSIVTVAELGAKADISYCNIEYGIDSIHVSDTSSVLNWGSGNMNEDPNFVDLPAGDLHLTDSSLCIGAGINSILLGDIELIAPSSDIEGNPRPNPQGSKADMGAYEHVLGSPIITGYDQSRIPDAITLNQNYPNPFSELTIFSYHLSVPCKVELSIFNIHGQQVATVISESQAAGKYWVEWDGSDLANGAYLYRLGTDKGIIQLGKLLIVK